LAICARKYGGDEVEIDHPFDLNFEYRPPALVGPQPDLALQAPGSGKLLAFRSSAHIFSTSSMADSIARHDRIRTTSLRRNRIDLPQCHSHVAPELSGGFEQLRKGPRVVAAVASSGCSSQILPCREGFTDRGELFRVVVGLRAIRKLLHRCAKNVPLPESCRFGSQKLSVVTRGALLD